MQTERAALIGAIAYGLVAIITFGHAASSAERREAAEYVQCLSRVAPDGYCFRSDLAPLSGMMAAMLWPLYWSWEVFDAD